MSERIVLGDGVPRLRSRAPAQPRLDGKDFTESNYAAIVTPQGMAARGGFGRAIPTFAIIAHSTRGDPGWLQDERLMTLLAQRNPRTPDVRTPQEVDAKLLKLLETKGADPDFWSLKDRDRSDSVHSIFQYPAMMVPLVQRRLLGAVLEARPDIQSVYDPFMGSGTSLVSGMHFGLDVYGNDINPLAVLISRVRTAQTVEFTIGAIAERVAAKAKADRRETIETAMANREKWFQPEVATELSRLRRAIRKCDNLWVRRFLWVTLAETIRLTSNDRTSTYKLHARPAEEIAKRALSPIAVFRDLARENASSFSTFRRRLGEAKQIKSSKYVGKSEVRVGDTRRALDDWGNAAPFDLLMTSPPYGDNLTTVTYGQHSYLPLHWIDFNDIDPAADIAILRTTQEIDRRSLGGAWGDAAWDEVKLLEASPRLKHFADGLPPKPDDGRSRLIRFYRDFGASLDSILKVMKPDSYMIWTVGNGYNDPLRNGDLFEIGDGADLKLWVLIAQPCDLMVRSNGERVREDNFKVAVLAPLRTRALGVEAAMKDGLTFSLDHYDHNGAQSAVVLLADATPANLHVLDLAVLNKDGSCQLSAQADSVLSLPSKSWENRHGKLKAHFAKVSRQIEDARKAHKDTVADLLAAAVVPRASPKKGFAKYGTYDKGAYSYPISRRGRIRDPLATSLLSAYSRFLARDAYEHDYSRAG